MAAQHKRKGTTAKLARIERMNARLEAAAELKKTLAERAHDAFLRSLRGY